MRCLGIRQSLFHSLSPGEQGSCANSSVAARHSSGVEARLDIQELDTAVEFFFRNGLAESTQRSYNSAKRRYIHFCKSHNMSPIPASERQLGQYVSYLALANLAHSTIKCYLAAVRHLHIAEGAADPPPPPPP